MSAVDDILSQIPISQLASQLGVDEGTAEQATRQALPALLGGMEANAQDPKGAQSLADALGQHSPALVEGGVNLDEVDTNDGEKIVGHVFGEQQGEVVNRLGAVDGGGGQNLIGKLLPMLAPIVLSYLAGRMGGGGGKTSAVSGGGMEDLLGGLLGGVLGGGGASKGGGGKTSAVAGGGMEDLLGGLLGGVLGGGGSAKGRGGDGGIGDILGGLLGGGRR